MKIKSLLPPLLTMLTCVGCSSMPPPIVTQTEHFTVPPAPQVNRVPPKGPAALAAWESCLEDSQCLSVLQTPFAPTTPSSKHAAPTVTR